MIIDFHTHTFPDRIAAHAIASMQSGGHAAAFSEGTVSALTASMAKAGIHHSVVLPVATNPTKLASMNNVTLNMNGKNGLIYFGAAHPLAEDWEAELHRLADAGIRGIKIHPFYQGVDIDDIRYLRMLGKAAELGLFTVMHAGSEIAYPGQVRCSPEMTANALKQLGQIPIVLAHMGGWKNWDRVAEYLVPTGCYIDTAISLGEIVPLDDGYYTKEERQLLRTEAFCDLVRTFGADRVLFGTDSPWSDQASQLAAIRSLPLTPEETTKILGENGRKLLHI